MSLYLSFLEKKLCVIPLRTGIPQVPTWIPFQTQLPECHIAGGWDKSGHNEYGLICGDVSGIVALDFDINDPAIYYEAAGETPLRKVGSKGFTAFYKYNGEKSQGWGKNKNGSPLVEMLSDKRITTIPPSPHRKTGKPYIWIESDSFDNLPFINPNFFVFINETFPKPPVRAWIPTTEYNRRVDLSEAVEMLGFVSSDCGRDDWIKIGMALRDEFGDAAVNLWHDWSAKANQRYKHSDAQAAWRSFGGHGITIGTLVYFAKDGGWVTKQKEETGFTVDISYLFEKKKEDRPSIIKVGGLLGRVADWITETAISPQPSLSLAAAITFMGMMKSGRICHQIRSARTNMMCISMAPTGSGKDWPHEAIDRLSVELGFEKHLMSKPTSGTALLRGIEKGHGTSLLKIDEIGRYMGHITGKNAQSFQSEIGDYIIELFSSANKTFRGRQYADEKANPAIVIKNPHLSCIGSSVPEKFKEACKASSVIDGFLNRWLMFTSNTWPDCNFNTKQSFDQSLLDELRYWIANHEILTDAYGNKSDPKIISFTPEAFDIFKSYETEERKLVATIPHPFNAMHVRSGEHVIKLSLVLCDDDFIGVNEVNSAISIVKQSTEHILDFAKGITDTDHEARVQYVLDIIKRNRSISREQLTYKTRKLSNRERKEIVEQLIESGEVVASQDGKKVTLSIVT